MIKDKKLVYFGREYECKVASKPDEANKFCENNPEYGVLCWKDGKEVYMAKLADEGKEVVKNAVRP